MKILNISVLASNKVVEEARQRDPYFSGYAVQKFSRLVAEGLACNRQQVTVLSTFYQPSVGRFWIHKREIEREVHYNYIPTPNNGLLRHIWLIIYCFIYVLIWGIIRRKDKVLICDVLTVSACIGAVCAARIIGLRRVGIMTDMPGLTVKRSKNQVPQMIRLLRTKINKSYLGHFSHYVFLTQKMDMVINYKHRPYIVMEGLVNADMIAQDGLKKDQKRVLLYAGGLHERYGLKMLVESFMTLDDDLELWLYGDGPFVDDLKIYIQRDPRIKYFGIRPNREVVEAEMRATLLINPRPTHEEFTQYSFPSKNMEYMVSGTPVVTTVLPGMPEEYYSYVFLFNEGETTEGYASVLTHVLSLSDDELNAKGTSARSWVLVEKNHIRQTKRIIQMLEC